MLCKHQGKSPKDFFKYFNIHKCGQKATHVKHRCPARVYSCVRSAVSLILSRPGNAFLHAIYLFACQSVLFPQWTLWHATSLLLCHFPIISWLYRQTNPLPIRGERDVWYIDRQKETIWQQSLIKIVFLAKNVYFVSMNYNKVIFYICNLNCMFSLKHIIQGRMTGD